MWKLFLMLPVIFTVEIRRRERLRTLSLRKHTFIKRSLQFHQLFLSRTLSDLHSSSEICHYSTCFNTQLLLHFILLWNVLPNLDYYAVVILIYTRSATQLGFSVKWLGTNNVLFAKILNWLLLLIIFIYFRTKMPNFC